LTLVAGALLTGFGLGFLVAATVGPIWLLTVRTTVRFGFAAGAAVGGGAVTIDTTYAILGVLGATALLHIGPLRVTFGVVGALVLALLGLRTLRAASRVRLGGEANDEVGSPRRAYLTSLAATASNPATIASWGAIFSAASVAGLAAVPLVVGIGVGSASAFLVLVSGVSLARRRIGPRTVRAVDVASGVGLLAFAGVLGFRALHD
jgi:putative LysE/RhtB family amino acid efflux pump